MCSPMSNLIAQLVSPLAIALLIGCGSIQSEELMPDGGEVDAGELSPDALNGDIDSGPVDTIAPTVFSTFPTNNSERVDSDTSIVIDFSEAMDTTSVEAAWMSELLPVGSSSFEWNEEGSQLTITPDEELPLAEGNGLTPQSVPATHVTVIIGVNATDRAGNALASPLKLDFATKRRMTVDLVRIEDLTRGMRRWSRIFNCGYLRCSW